MKHWQLLLGTGYLSDAVTFMKKSFNDEDSILFAEYKV